MKEQNGKNEIAFASVSDRGLNEKRPLNEDSFLADAVLKIFAVADGVGGQEAGEVASQTAVEVISEAFRHHKPGDDIEDLMEIAIQRANESIYRMSQEHPQFATMATTIVALHLDDGRATIGHVGDSRLYRLTPDGKQLVRETDDHSLVEEEVRAGRMTEEEAATHPNRNVISRALGSEANVEVDLKTIDVEEGTTFLLCSDGVTRHLSDAEIQHILAAAATLEAACEQIKTLCFERGAEDNLTAVVARFGADVRQPVEDDERTLLSARPGRVAEEAPAAIGAAAGAATGTTILRRPFDDIGASDAASLTAPPQTKTRVTYSADENPTNGAGERQTDAPPRKSSGGVLRSLLVLLLAAGLAALAFFGGMRYQSDFASKKSAANANSNAAGAPSATPVSESPEAVYLRKRSEVDRDPAAAVQRMTQDAQGKPMDSPNPEFLYLYGRALLLSGKPQDATQAFQKTISLIEQGSANASPTAAQNSPTSGATPSVGSNQTTNGFASLRVETRLSAAAAALKSGDKSALDAASKSLDNVIVKENASK